MTPRQDTPVVYAVLTWLVLAAAMIASAAFGVGIDLKTDNAMRLVEVRDLLAGQSWFDTMQHRMNTPYGLPMHWSHLIDTGIGGLILLFRMVASRATAEMWALYVWPVVWLLPVLLACARIGTRLAGRAGGLVALALAATCFAAAGEFQPGVIDHHNVQLALSLWFLASLVEFDRARWAPPMAAAFACLSLAIGLETLPYVVVGVATLFAWWVVDGAAIARQLRDFGLALVLASAAILFGAVADAYRFAASCDTFSGVYGTLGAAGGIGIAAMASLPVLRVTRTRRGIAVAVLSAVLIALVAIAAPDCLRGPYSQMDPRIGPIWLVHISEARSPFYFADRAPAFFVSGYIYAVLAVLASFVAILLVPRDRKRQAAFVALFALAAIIVTSWQVRGLPFAALFAMPGLAAFIVAGVARLHLPAKTAAAATVLALFISSDAGLPAAAGSFAAASGNQAYMRDQIASQKACLSPAAFTMLRGLTKGRVLAFIDQGPAILAYTEHSVMAGPYHRDASGILDTYKAFTGAPELAHVIVEARGIDYVVVCPPARDFARYREEGGAQSLLSQLADGNVPTWLVPLPSTRDMKLWRVVR